MESENSQSKISEEKKKALELLALTDTLPQIVWTANPDGILDYTNRRWLEYSGSDEPIDWGKFVHPEDIGRISSIWMNCITNGLDYEAEFRLLRKFDSSYRWHLVRALPMRDSKGKIIKWLGTNTDIHDRKLLVQTLEKERDLRDRFVSTLTHDLRSPLSAAKMSAQLILRKIGDLELTEKNAKRIVSTINRADVMVCDLLDASLIRAGKQIPLDIEECDLYEALQDLLKELNDLHGHRFKLSCPSDFTCYVDIKNLKRLVENLCNNSVRYGDPFATVSIDLTNSDKVIKISVHNFGNPLNDEEQRILFDPLALNDSARLKESAGRGLGLTIVKGIAEAHGGTVKLRSSMAEGTSFDVEIPKKLKH